MLPTNVGSLNVFVQCLTFSCVPWMLGPCVTIEALLENQISNTEMNLSKSWREILPVRGGRRFCDRSQAYRCGGIGEVKGPSCSAWWVDLISATFNAQAAANQQDTSP